MNSIWNKNVESFTKRFPQLSQIYKQIIEQITLLDKQKKSLLDFEPFTTIFNFWNFSLAKNGAVISTQNNLTLHSSYNPQREALNSVNNANIKEKPTTVFLGIGLGYQVVEWASLYQNKKLIIIEPEPLYFFASLVFLDWTNVFKIPNLVIAIECPTENILPLLENQNQINIANNGINNAYFFNSKAFTQHAQNYFDVINTIIQRNKSKNEINAATYQKFAKRWIKNSQKNFYKQSELQTICNFQNKASPNLPFCIVAAGPSLEQALPYLQEIKKRAIIVCVETALFALLKENIQPDFIILSDPQYWAYKHIASLSAPQSILITEISVYPAVFRFNCKKIMLCSSLFPIGQFVQQHTHEFGNLGAGGSVASSAWNFALFCGAKQIFTLGLDLSFPKNQTHIKGSSAEQSFHTTSTKTKSVENHTANILFSANTKKALNYKNEQVITDSRMEMFAWWFESKIAANNQTKTYSLCSQSMKIPGIEFYSLDDFLQKPEIQNLKNNFLNTTHKNLISKKQLEQIKNELETKINQSLQICKSIIKICEENLSCKNENLVLEQIQTLQNKMISLQINDLINLCEPSQKKLNLELEKLQIYDYNITIVKKMIFYSNLYDNIKLFIN